MAEVQSNEKMLKVEIKRDYWPMDGGAVLRAGVIADLPEKEAKNLIRLDAATFPAE